MVYFKDFADLELPVLCGNKDLTKLEMNDVIYWFGRCKNYIHLRITYVRIKHNNNLNL